MKSSCIIVMPVVVLGMANFSLGTVLLLTVVSICLHRFILLAVLTVSYSFGNLRVQFHMTSFSSENIPMVKWFKCLARSYFPGSLYPLATVLGGLQQAFSYMHCRSCKLRF